MVTEVRLFDYSRIAKGELECGYDVFNDKFTNPIFDYFSNISVGLTGKSNLKIHVFSTKQFYDEV